MQQYQCPLFYKLDVSVCYVSALHK